MKLSAPDRTEIIKRANDKLRLALRSFTVAELRWDYLCNVSRETKEMIEDELKRRGVSMEAFAAYVRGQQQP